jgi:hypothetical protein
MTNYEKVKAALEGKRFGQTEWEVNHDALAALEALRADLAEALEALASLARVMPDYKSEMVATNRANAVLAKHKERAS